MASVVSDLDQGADNTKLPLGQRWNAQIHKARVPITKALQSVAGVSARNPKRIILAVILASILLVTAGIFTNFELVSDSDDLWTPQSSKTIQHQEYIEDESGFPSVPRTVVLFVHAQGVNVLADPNKSIDHVFDAFDAVRTLPDYEKVCNGPCITTGVVQFWNESRALYEDDVTLMNTLSSPTYPNGRSAGKAMGRAVRDPITGIITEALSFTLRISLPDISTSEDFETEVIDTILALNEQWSVEGSMRVEILAARSFSDELIASVLSDLPLLPTVFIIMSVFTAFVFFKKHKVQSQTLLGLGAVIAVLLSIISGFGLLFICGVPFTSLTQILPFIIFGIGLDDAFVISGSHARTNSDLSPEDRIHETIEDVGLSISITTLSSTLAFLLGCITTIPAIRWLCLYAFPTIIFVLLYQLTFFVACIVLDDKRVRENRHDCLVCMSVKSNSEDFDEKESQADRIMGSFAEKLLGSRWMKYAVLLAFTGLAIASAISTSSLKQEFKATDIVSDDSYVKAFVEATEAFSSLEPVRSLVYFRNVDQSDPQIQQQMKQYVSELISMKTVAQEPDAFWLVDLEQHVADKGLEDLEFPDQLADFLAVPINKQLYSKNIVMDTTGNIIESRVEIAFDNLDLNDVRDQIKALQDQLRISESQPINQGKANWAFFTYHANYNIWEFYAISVSGLIVTAVLGVLSVSAIAMLLIPDWTASLFVLPLISVLYIDMLGFLQWVGVSINAVSYIALVMSIGLLVDFIMHVLLRYHESTFETRKDKTIDTLKTMGSSILVGALSTFLGTLPLAFSSSEMFSTIFYAFVGLVVLGATHGLILLPVLLAMWGPETEAHIMEDPEAPKELPTDN